MNKYYLKIIYVFIIIIMLCCPCYARALSTDATYVWSSISSDIPTNITLTQNERKFS